MIISEKEEWREFLYWIEENKDNPPEWLNLEMSMHKCHILWKEKIKSEKKNLESY
jgi:hypothetical protein